MNYEVNKKIENEEHINKKSIKIVIIIASILIILLIIAIVLLFTKQDKKTEDTSEKVKTITNQYIAYVKINPSIRLEYSQTCKEKDCKEPFVTNYKLINEDAETIFNNTNLLDKDNTLSSVLLLICTKIAESGVEFSEVEIYTNWNNFSKYLDNSQLKENGWNYHISVIKEKIIDEKIIDDMKVEKISKTQEEIEKENKEEIKIEEEEKEKDKEEKAKVKEEAKISEKETESNISSNDSNSKDTSNTDLNKNSNRNNTSIYLSDGVSYSLKGEAYCCLDCFSDSLINELSSSKGYHVFSYDSSTLDIRKIVELSSPYNSPIYFGDDLTSKIIEAGAENCAGLDSEPEKLTIEVCNEYNLLCE